MKEKKEPSVLAFDMDGVLFNFAKQYAAKYNKLHPDEKVTPETILANWDVTKTTEHGDKLWKEKGFFETMEPYKDYLDVFRWAYEHYNCYIATTSPHHLCAEKTNSVLKPMPEFNEWDIIFTNRKELLRYDYLFDDAPHNVKNVGKKCVVVTRPYNESLKVANRVSNAAEMKSFIKTHCVPKCQGEPNELS